MGKETSLRKSRLRVTDTDCQPSYIHAKENQLSREKRFEQEMESKRLLLASVKGSASQNKGMPLGTSPASVIKPLKNKYTLSLQLKAQSTKRIKPTF